jgi:hypothetical protein
MVGLVKLIRHIDFELANMRQNRRARPPEFLVWEAQYPWAPVRV